MRYLQPALLPALIISLAITSCEKDNVETAPLTSLTVVNAVVSGKPVRLGSNATTVNNNNFAQMALIAGDNNLYVYPVGDSSNPYFTNTKFSTQDREIYSLFLCGDTLAPEAVVIKEDIPYHQDSVAGIRFINLSPNSTPLNITLSTTPDVNEVTELAYKSYTDYISYEGKAASTYTFEVRAASDPTNVLTTYSLSASQVPRFANITLVIRGLVGQSPSLGVTRVNQDR